MVPARAAQEYRSNWKRCVLNSTLRIQISVVMNDGICLCVCLACVWEMCAANTMIKQLQDKNAIYTASISLNKWSHSRVFCVLCVQKVVVYQMHIFARHTRRKKRNTFFVTHSNNLVLVCRYWTNIMSSGNEIFAWLSSKVKKIAVTTRNIFSFKIKLLHIIILFCLALYIYTVRRKCIFS